MKLKRKTILLSSGIISVIILVAAAVFMMNGLQQKKVIVDTLKESVDLKIKGFAFTEVGEAKTKWEVRAETATYDRKQNLAVLEIVEVKLTTADGRVFLMNADKGIIATDKKHIDIQGHVPLVSDSGYKFRTDSLSYKDTEKKIFTQAPITMENQNIQVTGKGLIVYVDKGNVSIPSAVKARIS